MRRSLFFLSFQCLRIYFIFSGFTWRDTQQGKQALQKRKLLQMLRPHQKFWIYSASYPAMYEKQNVSCVSHQTLQVRPNRLQSFADFEHIFTYERVSNNGTVATRVEGTIENISNVETMKARIGGKKVARQLAHWNDKENCAVFKVIKKDKIRCELHVLESALVESYSKADNYTGCQEEFRSCANGSQHLWFSRDCENIYIPKYRHG
ncbi:hypothetical protein MTO96_051279 [Rhipicephalus appendiculatus]